LRSWDDDGVITPDEIERETDKLPFGAGRFSKSIEALAELSTPAESLLASCVGLNPSFQHRSVTLVGGVAELTKATNVVMAATTERLIVLSTGISGGTRDHVEIPYDGLAVVSASKKDITLGWPGNEMTVKGCLKPMVPPFVDAVRAQARPAS
jgi:hypothetical protein